MIKVLIADDQTLFMEGIKYLLERDPEINVTDLVSDGKKAFEKCALNKPDVILMDIEMPNCNGIEATEMIKKSYPELKIIILTAFDDDESIAKALEKGADGYMLKETNQQELIYTVKGVFMGMGIMHKKVYPKLVHKVKNTQKNINIINKQTDLDLSLTINEKKIIEYIVEGLENKDIAHMLYLSEGTVRNLISKLLRRFDLKDRIQLAVFSIKHGIYDIKKMG